MALQSNDGFVSRDAIFEQKILGVHRSHEIYAIPVSALLPADSPRLAGEILAHTQRLAEVDTPLPPILVHRSTMRVIDGMHRLHAAVMKGHDRVEVEFFDGTEELAFILSVKANTTHGMPLSSSDRRAAARRILHMFPHLSDRSIAEAAGLSAKVVRDIRERSGADYQQLNTRIGRDGRRYPVKPGAGRRRVEALLEVNPDASLRDIAREAAVSLGTAHAVRANLNAERRIQANGGFSSRAKEVRQDRNRMPNDARIDDARAEADSLKWKDFELLQKDPSLRMSEAGRELLHWLRANLNARGRRPHLVKAIPPHLSPVVVAMAEQCAELWQEFARIVAEHRSYDG